jgi:hypothetical protein
VRQGCGWSVTTRNAPTTSREQWPRAIKCEAIRLRREDGLTHRRIRQRLLEQFGAEVPEGTLGNWVSGVRNPPPPSKAGNAQTISERANRLLALTDLELTRMERRSGKPLELDRIERVARTLKSLHSIATPRTNGTRVLTLQDLQDPGSG